MKITAEEAYEIMETQDSSEYVILDVRNREDYLKEHIQGAIQIALIDLYDYIENEIPYKDILVLVYSNSGAGSGIADEILAGMGYTNVKDFGGILDWSYGII